MISNKFIELAFFVPIDLLKVSLQHIHFLLVSVSCELVNAHYLADRCSSEYIILICYRKYYNEIRHIIYLYKITYKGLSTRYRIRKRSFQLPEEVKDQRVALLKEWSHYKYQQHLAETTMIDEVMASQQHALEVGFSGLYLRFLGFVFYIFL